MKASPNFVVLLALAADVRPALAAGVAEIVELDRVIAQHGRLLVQQRGQGHQIACRKLSWNNIILSIRICTYTFSDTYT